MKPSLDYPSTGAPAIRMSIARIHAQRRCSPMTPLRGSEALSPFFRMSSIPGTTAPPQDTVSQPYASRSRQVPHVSQSASGNQMASQIRNFVLGFACSFFSSAPQKAQWRK